MKDVTGVTVSGRAGPSYHIVPGWHNQFLLVISLAFCLVHLFLFGGNIKPQQIKPGKYILRYNMLLSHTCFSSQQLSTRSLNHTDLQTAESTPFLARPSNSNTLLPPMSATSSPSPAAGSSGPGPLDLNPGSVWGPGSGLPGKDMAVYSTLCKTSPSVVSTKSILTLLAFSKYFLYLSSICFISSSFFFNASSSSSTRWPERERHKGFLFKTMRTDGKTG